MSDARTTIQYVGATVMDYSSGRALGTVSLTREEADDYLAGRTCQMPEGLARAGDLLSESEIERLAVPADTTVWLDV